MSTDDWPVEGYRPLLCLHVRQLWLGRLYQARFDTSDVIQETLVRAVRGRDQVRGKSEAEFVRWLQAIVGNVIIDLVREHGAGKRNPRLEQAIREAASDGSTPLATYGDSARPGPSTLAEKREELLALAAAMEKLPEAEQDAIVGHFILELPLAEVAVRMGRTEKAVAGLLFRGKQRLRGWLGGRA